MGDMRDEKELTFNIRFRFGSEFQEKSALLALDAFLTGWRSYYSLRHLRNRITLEKFELEELTRKL